MCQYCLNPLRWLIVQHVYFGIDEVQLGSLTRFPLIKHYLDDPPDVAGRQVDRQVDRQASRKAGRQASMKAGRQAAMQAGHLVDRQAGRPVGRQAGRQV